MPRTRTPLETAAGKLVSAISKEWSLEAGETGAELTERVMHTSHSLLNAARQGSIAGVIGSGTVSAFLGKQWVESHPNVWPSIHELERVSLSA
jgi:hypothetical protein